MRPQVGKRSQYNKSREGEKPSTPTQWYVEANTHHNIVMKRRFMYEEDAKEALNINTLETRTKLIRWFKSQIKQSSNDKLLETLDIMEDRDRHTL